MTDAADLQYPTRMLLRSQDTVDGPVLLRFVQPNGFTLISGLSYDCYQRLKHHVADEGDTDWLSTGRRHLVNPGKVNDNYRRHIQAGVGHQALAVSGQVGARVFLCMGYQETA